MSIRSIYQSVTIRHIVTSTSIPWIAGCQTWLNWGIAKINQCPMGLFDNSSHWSGSFDLPNDKHPDTSKFLTDFPGVPVSSVKGPYPIFVNTVYDQLSSYIIYHHILMDDIQNILCIINHYHVSYFYIILMADISWYPKHLSWKHLTLTPWPISAPVWVAPWAFRLPLADGWCQ